MEKIHKFCHQIDKNIETRTKYKSDSQPNFMKS